MPKTEAFAIQTIIDSYRDNDDQPWQVDRTFTVPLTQQEYERAFAISKLPFDPAGSMAFADELVSDGSFIRHITCSNHSNTVRQVIKFRLLEQEADYVHPTCQD
jgi:hypothetical protein